MTPNKTCRQCGSEKPASDFYFVPKGLLGTCKGCHNAAIQRRPIDKAKQRASAKRFAQKEKVRSWAKLLLKNAVFSSRIRGLTPPTITETWILSQPTTCPYLGLHLRPSPLKSLWQPSLDRIDNAIGYTPENTQLTSLAWNYLRNDLSIDEALRVIADVQAVSLVAQVA